MPFRKLEEPMPGLVVGEQRHFPDSRGYFKETWNQRDLASQLGISEEFVQDNLSHSHKGVLRGLHFQAPPHAQGKLVSVLMGEVQDVAVDIRKGSPTYGQSYSVILSGENHRIFYLPPGFAHGFLVLSDTCLFAYKCTNYYHKESEGGLMWNDPGLKIDWKLDGEAEISEKDRDYPPFSEFESPFSF